MSVDFNHTVVWSRESKASAVFLADMPGLAAPKRWGPFEVVTTGNGVNVDFMDEQGEITAQHYVFLVSEAEFDELFAGIQKRDLPIGPTLDAPGKARSITMTAGPASISRTSAATVITRLYGSGGWIHDRLIPCFPATMISMISGQRNASGSTLLWPEFNRPIGVGHLDDSKRRPTQDPEFR